MCGVAGFWTGGDRSQELMVERGEKMCSALLHRGPDDGGTWADVATGVVLGSRRLAILDLSSAGHMPMVSHCGRYVIAYNGEIYNFRELRDELEAGGNQFAGNSDTEVLVNAWSAWGAERTLNRLNGMFGFAIWDKQYRTLTLARDRLGEKPVYYGWSRDTFVFASELKALNAHPDFSKTLNRASLTLLLRFGYIPAPYSIYEGVYKLPPGHYVKIVAPNKCVPAAAYWDAKKIAEAEVSATYKCEPKEAADLLEELLLDSVRLRMLADVPVGAFLSGGIDSSLVVALMQAQKSARVKTFAIGFDDESYNEAHHAEKIAACLGTDHTGLRVSSQLARDVIPELPGIYDEPFADPSQIPTFLVSKLARRAVTVCLSGDGGDEVFGGYREYVLGAQRWRALRRLLPVTSLFSRSLLSLDSQSTGRLRIIAQFLQLNSPEAVHYHHVSGWKRPTEVLPNVTEPKTAFTEPTSWIKRADDAERMMYMDMVTYLPEDILTKLDRASMAVSLEARLPLLDYRVVEFAWRLPTELKILNNEGKRILRSIVTRYLPAEFFQRPKMGFGVPLAHWLRGPLRPWADDLLSPSTIRRQGILNPSPIRHAWKEHLTGVKNRSTELWAILMFQAWRDRWN